MAIPSFSKRLTIAVPVGLSAPWESGASQWLVPTLPGQPPVPPLHPPPTSNPPRLALPSCPAPSPLSLPPRGQRGSPSLGQRRFLTLQFLPSLPMMPFPRGPHPCWSLCWHVPLTNPLSPLPGPIKWSTFAVSILSTSLAFSHQLCQTGFQPHCPSTGQSQPSPVCPL